MSKCAFPRHGVVFFNGDNEPVASANICFQCEDILVWPPYFDSPKKDEGKYSIQGAGADSKPVFIGVHQETLPLWGTFFFDWANVSKSRF